MKADPLSPGEAVAVVEGELAPFDGLLLPPELAANLVVKIESLRSLLASEKVYSASLEAELGRVVLELDAAAVAAIVEGSEASPWSSGWVWVALAGVAIVSCAGGLVVGLSL